MYEILNVFHYKIPEMRSSVCYIQFSAIRLIRENNREQITSNYLLSTSKY